MEVEYDIAKNERNIRERGLSFEKARDFDFDTAVYRIDSRKDYGETRIRTLGKINDRVYVLVFKKTNERAIRVISFRKANKREVQEYEKERQKTESGND